MWKWNDLTQDKCTWFNYCHFLFFHIDDLQHQQYIGLYGGISSIITSFVKIFECSVLCKFISDNLQRSSWVTIKCYVFQEAACGYVIIVMALFWTTEVFPLAVTSLLPLFLFPVMGIMTAKDVSKTYMSNIIWLFINGSVIAYAVEASNLHRRFSLLIVMFVGSKPRLWVQLVLVFVQILPNAVRSY